MERKHKVKENLPVIICLVLIVVCILCLIVIFRQYMLTVKSTAEDKERYTAIRSEEAAPLPFKEEGTVRPVRSTEVLAEHAPVTLLTIDHKALLSENPDYAGWLDIPGTDISFPVYYSGDNEKYLRHAPDLSYRYGGSLFIDMETDENARNIIIYGHNMRVGTMFGRLKDYTDESFYKEHPYIVLYPADCDGYELYRVSSVYTCKGTDVIDRTGRIHFADGADVAAYAEKTASYSLHTGFEPAGSYERMLTLATCHGQSAADTRLIVNAVLEKTGGGMTSYFSY